MRFSRSFSGRSVFGIGCGFSFSRGDVFSGCLSLRYGGVGWALVLSFVDVCLLWPTCQIRVCILGALWLLGRLVDRGGELHYSFS